MINVLNTSKAYSEVYEFINVLGNEYKNKIPKNVYLNIQSGRDTNYTPKYHINQEVTASTFSKEALALISILNLKYWCDDSKEISRLKSIYMRNEELEKEKISSKNIFKTDTQNISSSQSLVEYKEESLWTKLINKIKKFLRINEKV